MKQFKIAIIATIITVCIMIGCTYACACADKLELYPMLTIVVNVKDYEECRVVTCMDRSRNKWEFYDEEYEWEVGDIANLLMNGYNTTTIYDDDIIDIIWNGCTDNLPEFFRVIDGH